MRSAGQFHGFTKSRRGNATGHSLQGREYLNPSFVRNAPSTFRSFTTVTIANESIPVLSYNINRSYLKIQNLGAATVTVAFDTVANISSIQIPANSELTLENSVPVNDINVFSTVQVLIAVGEGTYISE